LFRSNAEALIDELGRAGRNRFAVRHLPAQFGAEDFSDILPKPPISQIFC
jgi:hypothetical protein